MAGSNRSGRLEILKDFALVMDGEVCAIPIRPQRLLALLAVVHRRLPRSVVAGRLWPDCPAGRANASLRSTLWGFSGWEWSPVVIEGITLALSPDIRVDLRDGEALAAELIESGGERDSAEERLLHGDLLTDWSDDWLVVERERYRQLRLHALETVCLGHARSGRFARAVNAGMAAVAGEPLRESAHRALMTVFIDEGNAIEAVRQYHTYVELARREIGIGPSEELQELFQNAIADHGDDRVTAR